MALLSAEDIRHDKDYKAVHNVVNKYYLNAPYKHFLNYKRLEVKSQHDMIMDMIYPNNANYYFSDYGSGYEIDTTNKIIMGEVSVTFRDVEYNVEYYSKGYSNIKEDVVIVWAKLPYKKTKVQYATKDGKKKWRYDTSYKTAEFISNEKYHRMLPIQKPMFAIDKNLVKYLLSIKKEEYGDFHRRVCKKCLDVLTER